MPVQYTKGTVSPGNFWYSRLSANFKLWVEIYKHHHTGEMVVAFKGSESPALRLSDLPADAVFAEVSRHELEYLESKRPSLEVYRTAVSRARVLERFPNAVVRDSREGLFTIHQNLEEPTEIGAGYIEELAWANAAKNLLTENETEDKHEI